MKKQLIAKVILLLAFCTKLAAQETPNNKIPGNPALVSCKEELQKFMDADQGDYKYKGEDYFKTPKSSNKTPLSTPY